MADEAVKLQKLADYATAVSTTCGRILDDSLSGDSAAPLSQKVRQQIEEIKKLATETRAVAASAVKIGVVGGFSAGKTLLLGAIIGYADALPQDEQPVTGNITALHFELDDDLQSTEIDQFEAEFLDHDGFADCLRFMLAEANRRAAAAQFPPELIKPLSGVNPLDPATHGALESWGRAAWSACTSNPGYRNLIRELLTFTRAYRQCGVGLCGAKLEMSREVVNHGLKLANAKLSVQEMSFDDIPPAPSPISNRPDGLTSETLRAAFPLVRRVSARVRLSKQIWDFSELTGSNPFVLLDFPGLGAADSGVRDLYLCRRELAEVQTILILLDGKKSGGNEGNQLVDLLAENRRGRDIKDAVLVGVGRFDTIPFHKEGEAKLEAFAGIAAKKPRASASQVFVDDDEDDAPVPVKGSAAGKLTESDVFDGLPILNTCLRVAESVVSAGRRDRVVLLSPLLHLHSLKERYGDVIKIGSENFLRYLDREAEHGLHLQKLMKGVADRLDRDTPGSRSKPGLTRGLDDFATDGGVNRLRKLIQSHVQDHGLSQLLEDSRIKAGALRDALKSLAATDELRQVSTDRRTQDDRLAIYEKRFRQLSEFYGAKMAEIDKAPPLCIDRDGREVEVATIVHQETVHKIFEWAHWSRLLQASRDGIITQPQDDDLVFKDDDDEEEEHAVAEGFPTKSDDFLPPFEQTLEAMQAEVRKSVLRGVEDTLQRWNRDPNVVLSREDLAGPLADKTLTKRFRALGLGVQGTGLVSALRGAVRPEGLAEQILPEDGPDPIERTWSTPTDLFPLALGGGRGDTGLEFAWATKFQKAAADSRPDANRSHQSLVLRIRDEFVTTVIREMTEAVGVATYRINQRIKRTLTQLVDKLKVVTSRQDVLAELVRDKLEGTDSGSAPVADSLALVRQLAGTRWPLDDAG